MSIVEINSKYDVDLEGIHFCIRALDLTDSRVHVSHLLVSRGFLYATDGRRLHRYRLKRTLKPGLYRVLKNLKNHILIVKTETTIKSTYPKTSHLFTKKPKESFDTNCHKDNYIYCMTKIIRDMPENQTINPEFIKDINEYCTVYVDKERIIFESENKTAILMPMRN